MGRDGQLLVALVAMTILVILIYVGSGGVFGNILCWLELACPY
jgi:hypothetical protein